MYWYDESGNIVSESDQNGVFQNDYIYFNGQKITWVDLGHGTPTTNNYYLSDHLGNTRMIINQAGVVCYDVDYYPWGAEQKVYTNTCPVQNYKFTGKERDPDLGEDYFGARFYKGDMSRFFSPDWSAGPEPVPYAKLDNPKTLNLYSYVGNNPTTLRDPDGHDFGTLASDSGSSSETNPDPCAQDPDHCVTVRSSRPPDVPQIYFLISGAVGHHGFPRAFARFLKSTDPEAYRWLNKEFVTGRLADKHYFDAAHRAYNEEVQRLLKLDSPDGQREVAEDVYRAAQKILDSDNPAIRGFLDQMKTADGLTGRQALQRALQGDSEALGDFVSGAIGEAVEMLSEF